jgi:hypothetical protein
MKEGPLRALFHSLRWVLAHFTFLSYLKLSTI